MKVSYVDKLSLLIFGICESQRSEHRIVGGYVVTSRNDFAYQASIRLHDAHFCGGVLLDNTHVLTAAHCVADLTKVELSQLTVVLGDLNVAIRDANTIKVKVDKVTSHEDYGTQSHVNDIAILRLQNGVKISSLTQPIDLWNSSSIPDHTTSCIVSGWGVTISGADKVSRVLRAAKIYPVDHITCNQSYVGLIKNGMMCAAAPGKDSCQGDSGGPLVCDNKLAGLVSWGVDCANPNYPGVYTFVNDYTEWIEANNSQTVAVSVFIIITCVIVLFM